VSFQISSFKFGWLNPWWSFKLNKDSSHEWMLEGSIGKKSQDLEDLYCPFDTIWIADVKKLKISKTFYGQGFKFCELN
jgi:hypothetical protein